MVLSYLRMSVYHQWQNYGHEQHRSMLHSLLPNICISKTQEIVKRRLSGTQLLPFNMYHRKGSYLLTR